MFKIGDKVNWIYTPKGSYGYSINIAAIVVEIGSKKIKIRVARQNNGQWQQVFRWVEPKNLSARINVVPEVDDVVV